MDDLVEMQMSKQTGGQAVVSALKAKGLLCAGAIQSPQLLELSGKKASLPNQAPTPARQPKARGAKTK